MSELHSIVGHSTFCLSIHQVFRKAVRTPHSPPVPLGPSLCTGCQLHSPAVESTSTLPSQSPTSATLYKAVPHPASLLSGPFLGSFLQHNHNFLKNACLVYSLRNVFSLGMGDPACLLTEELFPALMSLPAA